MEFLDNWQTLIGTILGGLIALSAALVVAFRVERREDLSAAMVVVSTLVPVRVAAKQLNRLVDEKHLTDLDERATFVAEKLVWMRPKLSPMVEASIARIMPIEVTTAAHLTFFLSQYTDMEQKLESYGSAVKQFQSGREPERGQQYLLVDARSATQTFFDSAKHAECAEHLLEQFVLSRNAFLHRVWFRWFPDTKTKNCREMLKYKK